MQQESENNVESTKLTTPAQKAAEPHEQRQQHYPLIQRIRVAIQMVEVILNAAHEDTTARQIEDALVKRLEELNISAQSVQKFREGLEKLRQVKPYTHQEEIYVMGGILIYCGIFLPILISLGTPDFSTRFAWITFTISFPCTVSFFLTRFLKEKNNISGQGRVHGTLAFFAEIGAVAMTAGLFFHIWNIVGWVFITWTIVLFIGYQKFRWNIYYRPFLSIFAEILKSLNNRPPVSV